MPPTTTTPHVSQPVDLTPALDTLLHLVFAMWPVLVLVVAAFVVKKGLEIRETRRLARSGIEQIDTMDGRTFEVYLSGLFRRLGYAVELTRLRGDYGADLILTKDGHKIAVQAKRYSKPVGVRAVQEALAAAGMYGCERALVVTNRSFTTQAIKLASANDVRLWDRDALVNAILDADDDSGAAGALADAI